jgi:hypothetical protein
LQRCVERDAITGRKAQVAIDIARDALCGEGALGRCDGAAACTQLRAQARALRAEGGIRKRHPHVPMRTVALEPEQQVGRTAAGKAFRLKRTCTMLPASP